MRKNLLKLIEVAEQNNNIVTVKEIENLQKEIADLEELLGDELKIRAYIAAQLNEIKKKYGKNANKTNS